MKKELFVLGIVYLIIFNFVFAYGNINWDIPSISEGNYDDEFYYGTVSLQGIYSGTKPFMNLDYNAFYTINANELSPEWLPAEAIKEEFIDTVFGSSQETAVYYELNSAGFSDGRYAVVYEYMANDQQQIVLQLFDADGNPLGQPEYAGTLNNLNVIIETQPGISILNDDRIMIVWDSRDSYYHETVYGRIFSCQENRWLSNEEFEIDPGVVLTDKSQPSIINYNNKFIVTWIQAMTDGNGDVTTDIQVRQFDFDGIGEVKTGLVPSAGVNNFYKEPKLMVSDQLLNEYLLIYGHLNPDDGGKLFIIKLNENFESIGNPVEIPATNPVLRLFKMDSLQDAFVITWLDNLTDGSKLFFQLYDKSNIQAITEKTIVDSAAKMIFFPNLSVDENDFIISWRDRDFSTRVSTFYLKKYSSAGNVLYDLKTIHETVNQTRYFTACVTGGNGIAACWSENTGDGNYILQSRFYPGLKQLYQSGLNPQKDIDIQFKLEDQVTGLEIGKSPIRSYKYADPAQGKDCRIIYPHEFTNINNINVGIELDENGKYKELAFYLQKLPFVNGIIQGSFDDVWEEYGNLTSSMNEMNVELEHGYCYCFKYDAITLADETVTADSENIVFCDLEPPIINLINEQLAQTELAIELNCSDEISGIDSFAYKLNTGNTVPIESGIMNLTLLEGSNHILITAADRAGNTTEKHIFRTVELINPEIKILGLKDGNTYDNDIVFQYLSNVPLRNAEVHVNNNFLQRVFEERISLYLDDGSQLITVTGTTFNDEVLETSVNVNIVSNTVALNLISPQSMEYGTTTIPITYWSSKPLDNVWYVLDSVRYDTDMILTNLSNGDHELTVFGISRSGTEVSQSVDFSVREALPELNLLSPVDGTVYTDKDIEVIFDSNSIVTYEMGEDGGELETGDFISVEEEGVYQIFFTATHPDSGNRIRKKIDIKIDTVEPEIEIMTPEPRLYIHNDIPVTYKVNKELKSLNMFLNGEEVSSLTDLATGEHSFEIIIEDFAGRILSGKVDFRVNHLAITSPEQNDRIVSSQIPNIIPFVYEKDGDFDALSYLLDDEPGVLINEEPGVEIPIACEGGEHEINLRGRLNEFQLSRRVNFQIGRKNITAGNNSIDYTYQQIGNSDEYYADVILTLRNTGDIDVDEIIPLRFDHIGTDGSVRTYFEDISELKSKSEIMISISGLTAGLGDQFILTVDPDAILTGEYPEDNIHQIEFQTGQILSSTSSLSDENIYLENVSVINPLKIDTAGAVSYVEVHTPTKVFVDDTDENGFCTIVDMGLLTAEHNYVKIFAFGNNGVVLDTRKHFFKVKKLSQEEATHTFPWGMFSENNNTARLNTATGSFAARSGIMLLNNFMDNQYDRIIMSQIDPKVLAQAQASTVQNSLLKANTVIPVIKEGNKLVYRIMTLRNSVQAGFDSFDVNDVPVLGGRYNLPNGKGYITITEFNPFSNICISLGAIPILDGGSSYVNLLNQRWQETIDDINELISDNLDLEEMLDEFIDDFVSDAKDFGLNIYGNLFHGFTYIGYDFVKGPLGMGILGAFFLGFTDLSIDGDLQIQAEEINLDVTYDAKVCLVCKDPGNILNGYDLVAKADLNIQASTAFHIHTPGLNVRFIGLVGLRLFQFIHIPLGFAWGGLRIDKQHFYIPFGMNAYSNILLSDGQIGIVPAYSRIYASCDHHSRLAAGSLGINLLLIFGGGADIKAYLDIDAEMRGDLIFSTKPEFTPDLRLLYYAYGNLDISIIIKYYFYIAFIKITKRKTEHINFSGEVGERYSDEEVNNLINEATIDMDI